MRTLTGREFLVCLALLAVALYAGNLAAFHGWASSAPPTVRADWHRVWAARFFWVSIAALAALVAVIVRGARAARRRAA